ncbi:MAG: hypothetical protein HQK50_08855 [Oligoflexia bacterium]|nr:hypothetical protein [Oligoflexia bacterium]MBF0365668.1 hypothetical protein [Oligoflexia bacterium]
MKIRVTSFMLITLLFLNNAYAEKVVNAKGAELTLHRLERLVFLKKINESFLTKFRSLELFVLEPQTPEDPSYKSLVKEYANANGSHNVLSVFLDENGKAMLHEAASAGDAQGAPTWPETDPVTLSENALHFVLEEGAKGNPEILPFYNAFLSLEISQASNPDGSIKAHVKMVSKNQPKALLVIMNSDGTFNSSKILD